MQVFVANAWICACQATDRDLESSSTRRKVNAWICARRATDGDLESVSVNAWICTCQATDRDLESALICAQSRESECCVDMRTIDNRPVNAWMCAPRSTMILHVSQ